MPIAIAGRVSFGSINRTSAASKTKQEYPLYPANEEVKAKVDWLVEHLPYEKQIETEKAQMARLVVPFWFRWCSGKSDLPSSVIVAGNAGQLLVTQSSRLTVVTEELLAPVLGDRVRELFAGQFKITVDSKKIPVEKQQAIVDGIQALFNEQGCMDALTVKETFEPRPEFFSRRHLDLSPEQNASINEVARIVQTVKVRM